jgi:hypothetical protein
MTIDSQAVPNKVGQFFLGGGVFMSPEIPHMCASRARTPSLIPSVGRNYLTMTRVICVATP